MPLDIKGFGTPSVRAAAIVGTAIVFDTVDTLDSTATFSVVAAPNAGAATFSGRSLTPDQPGVWQCKATLNGDTRYFEIVAFPASVLTYGQLLTPKGINAAYPRSTETMMLILKNIASEPRIGAALFAAMTTAVPLVSKRDGNIDLDLRQYGAS
jgi:hypothetical protein